MFIRVSLFFALFLTSSCGTILSGTSKTIHLVSSDGRSEFKAELSQNGKTENVEVPGLVSVSRDKDDILIKVKESKCYKSTQTIVESKVNPFTFISALFGVFSSSSTTTDSSTGALWSYDDTVYIGVSKKSECRRKRK